MYGCQIPAATAAPRGDSLLFDSDTWAVKARETLANDDRTIKVEEGDTPLLLRYLCSSAAIIRSGVHTVSLGIIRSITATRLCTFESRRRVEAGVYQQTCCAHRFHDRPSSAEAVEQTYGFSGGKGSVLGAFSIKFKLTHSNKEWRKWCF